VGVASAVNAPEANTLEKVEKINQNDSIVI